MKRNAESRSTVYLLVGACCWLAAAPGCWGGRGSAGNTGAGGTSGGPGMPGSGSGGTGIVGVGTGGSDMGGRGMAGSGSGGTGLGGSGIAGSGAGGASTLTLSLIAGVLGGSGQADGTGAAARFFGPTALVSYGAGSLFVADTGNHTIRKIVNATGVVTTLAGSPGVAGLTDGTGTSARFNLPQGVASDGSGNLFVADTGNCTIRKVVIATGVVTNVAGTPGVCGFAGVDGTGAAARFVLPTGVASDGAGNLFVAERNLLRRIVIATGVVTTLAVSGISSGSTLASDGAGGLFVADLYNHTIRKVDITTGAIGPLVGSPGIPGSADGTGANARLHGPAGVAADGAGNLFVADNGSHTIRKVVVATDVVTTLAGFPGSLGSSDGMGTDARFNRPQGLASDGAGNLFVADNGSHAIRKVVVTTGAVATLAGPREATGSTDGTGATARFNRPQGLASDGAGNLFVADNGSHTIRKVVVATGVVTTLAGSPGTVGGSDGTGAAARFNLPQNLATDRSGNLFVTDAGNHTIRKVVIATGLVTTLAGHPGSPDATDGTGAAARFYSPQGLASDGMGNLFVADRTNHSIRKVVLATGDVTTLAGPTAGRTSFGSADGTGVDARFYYPEGVASDGAGNLFVADTSNHTIRKIVAATGVVTTLAGAPSVPGSTDDTGANARFNLPRNLVSDGAGNLFVADTGNHMIRKIVVTTGLVTTLVGSPERTVATPGPLPAALNMPAGLAIGPAGSLFIADENAILVVQ